MKFQYETRRLGLTVLKTSAHSARQVLEFYNRNRSIFERYEAARPADFYTETYQKALLEFEYNQTIHNKSIRFWIYLRREPARIIGTICFYDIVRPIFNRCETGYKFDPEFWHKGYAREAMSFGISLMFNELNLHRVEAFVMKENIASIRLLSALDFQLEGICQKSIRIRGKWEDHMLFALVR